MSRQRRHGPKGVFFGVTGCGLCKRRIELRSFVGGRGEMYFRTDDGVPPLFMSGADEYLGRNEEAPDLGTFSGFAAHLNKSTHQIFCEDCIGVFMNYRALKEKLEAGLAKFPKMKPAEREAAYQEMMLRLMFEIGSELQSLSISYRKMADMAEKRAQQPAPVKPAAGSVVAGYSQGGEG